MTRQTRALIIGVVMLVTLAAYLGTLRHGFVYDDPDQIVNNPAVHSWSHLPRYFTSDVWPHTSADEVGNFYRPVFLLWLLLNYTIGGLNPMWWHLTTIVLHLLAVLLVYLLAQRLTKDELVAAGGALLFGLHPVHVEGVAWVSGATEPLLAVFFLTSFLFYLKSRGQVETQNARRVLWFISSLGFYVLAMLEKETAVVLPAIVFFYEYLLPPADAPNNERTLYEKFSNALASSAPYLALTVVYLGARFFALKGLGHSITSLPPSTMILTWPYLLLYYVRLLVWPIGLSVFYDTPYVTAFSVRYVILPALIIILLGVALYLWSRRSRLVAFFSLWMLLPILPLLNLSVFKEGEIAHDRYLYLPSIGFCLIVALAVRQIKIGRRQFYGEPAVQLLLLLMLAVLLGVATAYQSTFWASDQTLSARGVAIAPNNFRAANNLAKEMALQGNYNSAITLFRQALARKPEYWLPNFNLGYVYYRVGKLPEAEHYLKKAIAINPNDAAGYRFLGYTLLEAGRLDEAVTELRRAISLQPKVSNVHYALGTALKQKGDLKGAMDECKLELALNPNHQQARQLKTQVETEMKAK